MMEEHEDRYFLELDDDGYPTDETLENIEKWGLFDGFSNLLESIAPLMSEYGRCEINKSKGVWEVATGGWSGNESIIRSLQGNYVFWALRWELSKKGGYYEFSI